MPLNDRISVIIPSFRNHSNLKPLLGDLSSQSVKHFDIQIVKGISPNGKARNIGANKCKGNIFIFLDDDIRLGHKKVFENLISAVKEENIGLTGTSQKIPLYSSWFQKKCAAQLHRTEYKIVDVITESDMVTTACCAIRREVFYQLSGFNEKVIRGVDPEFRYRLRQKGYRVVIVPKSWHYHPMPANLSKLIKIQYRNGYSSAFVFKFYYDLLVETPNNYDTEFISKRSLSYRTFRFTKETMEALIKFNIFLFITNISYRVGYLCGLICAKKRLD